MHITTRIMHTYIMYEMHTYELVVFRMHMDTVCGTGLSFGKTA